MSSGPRFGAWGFARFAPFCYVIVKMSAGNRTSRGSQNKAKLGRPPLHPDARKTRCQLNMEVEGYYALQMLAIHEGSTMSSLVEAWAIREWRRRQWSGRIFRLPVNISRTVGKMMRRDMAKNEHTFDLMADELHDRPWYGLPLYWFWQVHRALANLCWRPVRWGEIATRWLRGPR